jgi:hypothetical protein
MHFCCGRLMQFCSGVDRLIDHLDQSVRAKAFRRRTGTARSKRPTGERVAGAHPFRARRHGRSSKAAKGTPRTPRRMLLCRQDAGTQDCLIGPALTLWYDLLATRTEKIAS